MIPIQQNNMNLDIKGTITYEENRYSAEYMNELVQAVMQRVIQADILSSGEAVGIAMKRSPLLVASYFAMLKLQVPFMPIDVDWPEKRSENLSKAVGLKIILTDDICEKMVNGMEGIQKIKLDEEIINDTEESIDITPIQNESAYIICTSGTTGNPKAVEIRRTGFQNFLQGFQERIPFEENQTIICMANFSFDIIFVETILALSLGLHVILTDEREKSNPKKIAHSIIEHDVDVVQMTPSRVKQLQMIDSELSCLKKVKLLLLGGEKLDRGLLETLQNLTDARIFNLYGPTETTVWSTVSEMTEKQEIDVGTPISGQHVYVLDDKLCPVADGEVGEICIAGAGVGKYKNNPEQEQLHFIDWAYQSGVRIYRTGDLGQFNENGDLLCLGRIDAQIKFNGHRIELEEIEWYLNLREDIQQAVACFDKNKNRLVVFYIADENLSTFTLINELTAVLPEYMVPSKYIRVKEFCFSHNGKLDRNALLASEAEGEEQGVEMKEQTDASQDEIYNGVKEIFADVMEEEVTDYPMDSKLLDIGLNSLLIVKVIVKVETAFDIETEDDLLIEAVEMTVKDFCDYIKKMQMCD